VTSMLIRGAGNKAFCAGGDVVALYNAGKSGRVQDALTFFREEYRLNYLISKTSRNYIAWLNGITMGGGVGLSVHGRTRIATENSLFAMPETAIGFFPDVGGSHFLSRLPGELGTYLALTGARLKGADLVHAGIANHYAPSHAYVNLINKLNDNHQREVAVNNAIASVTVDYDELPPFTLAPHLPTIERCFKYDTVEEIIEALKAEKDDVEFAQQTLKTLSHLSPLSLKVTLMQVRMGATQDLAECLKMEYRMASHFMQDSDFYEGVNKMLISKDRTKRPQWKHASLKDVSDKEVERFFGAPFESDELELESVLPLARGKPYVELVMNGPFVKNIPQQRVVGENPYPLWEPLSTQYEENLFDMGGNRGSTPGKASAWSGYVPARLDTGTPALASWKRIFEMRYWSYLIRHRNAQFEGFKGQAFERGFAEATLRELMRKTLGVAIRKVEQRRASQLAPLAQKLMEETTKMRAAQNQKSESEILSKYGIVDGKFVLKAEYEKAKAALADKAINAFDAKADALMKKALPGGLTPDQQQEIAALAAARSLTGGAEELTPLEIEAIKAGLMSNAENNIIADRLLDDDAGNPGTLPESDVEKVKKAQEKALAAAIERAKATSPAVVAASGVPETDASYTADIIATVSGVPAVSGKGAAGVPMTGLAPADKELLQSNPREFQAALRAFVDTSVVVDDPKARLFEQLSPEEQAKLKIQFTERNVSLCTAAFEKAGYIPRDWLIVLERAADENPVVDPLLSRLYTVHQALLKATVKSEFKPEGLDANIYADQTEYISVLKEQIKMLIGAIMPYIPMPKSQLGEFKESLDGKSTPNTIPGITGASPAQAIILAQKAESLSDPVALRVAAAERLAQAVGIPMPDFVKKGLELEQNIRAAIERNDFLAVQELQAEMKKIDWNPSASLSVAEETKAALAVLTEKKTPEEFDAEFEALMGGAETDLTRGVDYVEENKVLFSDFLKELEKKSVQELIDCIEEVMDKPNLFTKGELSQLAPVLEAAKKLEVQAQEGTLPIGPMKPLDKPHPEVSPLDALRLYAQQIRERAQVDVWSQEDDAEVFPDELPTPERWMLKSHEQLAAEEFHRFLGLGAAGMQQDVDYFLHRPKFEDVRPPEWPTHVHPDEFTFDDVIATPCVPPGYAGNKNAVMAELSITLDEVEKMHDDHAYVFAVRQDRIFRRFLKISEHCTEADLPRLASLYSRAQEMVAKTVKYMDFKFERLTPEGIDANTPEKKTLFKSSRAEIDKFNADVKADLLKIAEEERQRQVEAEKLSAEIKAFEEEMLAKPKQPQPVWTKDDLMDALNVETVLAAKQGAQEAMLADDEQVQQARSTPPLQRNPEEFAREFQAQLSKKFTSSPSTWYQNFTGPREPSLQPFEEIVEKPSKGQSGGRSSASPFQINLAESETSKSQSRQGKRA